MMTESLFADCVAVPSARGIGERMPDPFSALARLERYERRALSRRKTVLRVLEEIKLGNPFCVRHRRRRTKPRIWCEPVINMNSSHPSSAADGRTDVFTALEALIGSPPLLKG
jgi:hypothetical protein